MKDWNRCLIGLFALAALLTVLAPAAWAQAVGGAEEARPVAGDPGISSMVVFNQPEFSVLRDYAEPGATRRMHSHDNVKWIVFTLVTGKLVLTFEGEAPIEVAPGQVIHFKGTTRHTFTNVANVTATIVEVFGKPQKE
jgi:quercetin dioxygenase-like cupin family protein